MAQDFENLKKGTNRHPIDRLLDDMPGIPLIEGRLRRSDIDRTKRTVRRPTTTWQQWVYGGHVRPG